MSTTRGPYNTGVRRREQIVKHAVTVFAESGYTAGSLRAVARNVGVSPASIVQHFGSKEGLLTAVLDEWERQTTQLVTSEHKGLAFFEHLGDLMRFHIAHPGYLELFLKLTLEATRDDHPAHDFITMRYQRIFNVWGTQLRQACELGEVSLSEEQITREITAMTAEADGLEIQWLLNPSMDLVGAFESYLSDSISRWKSISKQ